MVKRIIKIVISIFYLLLLRFKNSFRTLIGKGQKDSCIVLLYHSVSDEYLDRFLKQLEFIQKKTVPVSIDFKKITDKGTRYSTLTFDDAFQSVLKNVMPVLEERKINSTIFIPAERLGQKPHWLSGSGHMDENEIIATKEQLLKLNSELVDFGSHTSNHCHLTELTDEQAYAELFESKKLLEKIFKRKIKHLAFPFGEYDKRILDISRGAGYENVFTVDPYSPYDSIFSFVRGRVVLDPWDWTVEYRLKIYGAYSWMPYASKIKSKIKSIIKKGK